MDENRSKLNLFILLITSPPKQRATNRFEKYIFNLIAIYHHNIPSKNIEKYRTQNCYDLELNSQN